MSESLVSRESQQSQLIYVYGDMREYGTSKQINIKELTKINNYNEDVNKPYKRPYMDLDGHLDEISEKDFYLKNDEIINVLKQIENVSILSSSHYTAEKYEYEIDRELTEKTGKTIYKKDSNNRIDKLVETKHKLSYRLTFFKECMLVNTKELMTNFKEYIINTKLPIIKELFNKFNLDITIGTESETINVDTGVYRCGASKMRCVNAYKYSKQKERFNKLIKGNIKDTLITYIPEDCELIEYISKKYNKPIKNIIEDNNNNEYNNDDNIFTNSNNYNNNYDNNNDNEEYNMIDLKNKEVDKILKYLKPFRFDNYEYWFIIGCIFINENLNLDIFDKYSKSSKKYNKNSNNIILKNLKNNLNKGYKIATLYKWLKEDNEEEFKNLQKTRSDFWNILKYLNPRDIAYLYYSISEHKYIYKQGKGFGWYEYNKNNILVHTGEEPASMTPHITNTLLPYITEQRNLIVPTDKYYREKMKSYDYAYKTIGTKYNSQIISFLKELYMDDELINKIDNNINVIAFEDYLYDININKFRPIEKSDYISVTTGYKAPIKIINNKIELDTNKETTEEIKKLLKSIFEDDDLIEYYLITTGLSLFTTKLQSIYLHVGTGGNGKGVLGALIRKSLGMASSGTSYFTSTENDFLTTNFEGQKPNPSLANARSSRYLFVSEPDNGKNGNLQTDFIKRITGGDPITCRDLNKSNISYVPMFSVNLQCNNIPSIDKVDKGILRRIKILPYNFSFVDKPKKENERKRDYKLQEKISSDIFRNNFILLLFEIASKYYNVDEEDIKIPKCVSVCVNNYIEDNNPVKSWLNKYITITDNKKDRIEAKKILDIYNSTVDKTSVLTSKKFNEMMTFNGFTLLNSNSKRYYTNIIEKSIEEIEAYEEEENDNDSDNDSDNDDNNDDNNDDSKNNTKNNTNNKKIDDEEEIELEFCIV
jgi:P4 family phage/plasmid primase-like protien